MSVLLRFPPNCSRAGLETEAVIAGLQNVAEPIEQRRGHLRITEDRGPFAEAEVGGDGDAGALVEFAQQMEEQRTARSAERQLAKFVQDHEIELGGAFGKLSSLTLGLFLFKGVDQLDGRQEADLAPVMFDSLNAEGGGDMILYR